MGGCVKNGVILSLMLILSFLVLINEIANEKRDDETDENSEGEGCHA